MRCLLETGIEALNWLMMHIMTGHRVHYILMHKRCTREGSPRSISQTREGELEAEV